jgi:hypothetical protein
MNKDDDVTENIVNYPPDSASWLAATEKEEKGSIWRPRSSRLRLLSGSGVDTHSTTMSQPPLRFRANINIGRRERIFVDALI